MTDGDTVILAFFLFFYFGFNSYLIAGYTIEMSKSNQSVHGFFFHTFWEHGDYLERNGIMPVFRIQIKTSYDVILLKYAHCIIT